MFVVTIEGMFGFRFIGKNCLAKQRLDILAILLTLTFGLAFPRDSVAQIIKKESLGVFSFSEFYLSPRLYFQEPERGGFELKSSWAAFRWTRGDTVHGVIKFGTSDLVDTAIWYTKIQKPEFGVTEAYMEGESPYGDLRVGLLNIGHGFEGSFAGWGGVLPESLARRQGWFVKRDLGMQFLWDTKPWNTSIAVHNGESDAQYDGRFWGSGKFGYKSTEGYGVMLSAQVGQTKTEVTQGSVAQSKYKFVFDPNENAKIRHGTLSLFYEGKRSVFLIEGTSGQILQKDSKQNYFTGHADWIWNVGGDLSILIRYEQLLPDQSNVLTLVKATTLGFNVSSGDLLQSLSIYATSIQEEPQIPNNEMGILFRIRSQLL